MVGNQEFGDSNAVKVIKSKALLIDVAKQTLDIASHKHAEPQVHLKVSNDLKGMKALEKSQRME